MDDDDDDWGDLNATLMMYTHMLWMWMWMWMWMWLGTPQEF